MINTCRWVWQQSCSSSLNTGDSTFYVWNMQELIGLAFRAHPFHFLHCTWRAKSYSHSNFFSTKYTVFECFSIARTQERYAGHYLISNKTLKNVVIFFTDIHKILSNQSYKDSCTFRNYRDIYLLLYGRDPTQHETMWPGKDVILLCRSFSPVTSLNKA